MLLGHGAGPGATAERDAAALSPMVHPARRTKTTASGRAHPCAAMAASGEQQMGIF